MRNRYLAVFAILSILTFTVGCGNKNIMNGDIGDSDSTQIDISGVYVNLNKTDPVRSYSFSPDPDNNFSGSYESTWDFDGFITNGGTQNYSGGWAVADGNLVLVDSSIVGMNEIVHSLTGEDTDEYNGTVWYIYQDYIINSEGKIEPSVGSSNTFIRDASWGYYSYSFKDDGTVQRTSKKAPF